MRNLIKKEIEKVVGKADFDVFRSENFGDYSSNVAMILKKNPQEIAQKIKSDFIEKIETAGPGFLNFWLSEKGIERGLKEIFKKPKIKHQKIQVEFISANPTGELHIGHGRGAFYGNALANVLEKAGHKVEQEYFINDSEQSIQIKSLHRTAGIIKLEKEGALFADWKKPYETEYLKKLIKSGKVNFRNVEKEIQKDNEDFITNVLRIKFDKWFSEENKLRKKGKFEETLRLLEEKGFVYKKDGAKWLKTSDYGDDKDEVIVRSSGTYGYFLSDIAYHINKFERGFDKVIDVWGADHQGHIKRMLAVKKMLRWKGDLDILISQMVTVKEKGEIKKLSKRKGTIILLKDLVKEIGLDACRWFYLEKALSTQMEIDLALAKERSKKNPVYYVQYAGARMCSILAKANLKSQISNLKIKNLKLQERNLLLKLIQFTEVVEDIIKDYQVQRLITYAYELAKVFTDFYENVPVLKAETEELKKTRLNLVFITRKILEQALGLIGISAPEKM